MAKSVYLGSRFFKALSSVDDEDEDKNVVNPGNIQQSPQTKKVGDGAGSRGGVTTTDVVTTPSGGTRNVYQSERTPRRLGNVGVKQGSSLGGTLSTAIKMPSLGKPLAPPTIKPPAPPKPPTLRASLYLGEDLFHKGVGDPSKRMYNPNLGGEPGRVGTPSLSVESFSPPTSPAQKAPVQQTLPGMKAESAQPQLPGIDTPESSAAPAPAPAAEAAAPAPAPAPKAEGVTEPATAGGAEPTAPAPSAPGGETPAPKEPSGQDPTQLPELPKPPKISMTSGIPGAKETNKPCSTGINPSHSYVGKFPGANGCIYTYSEGGQFKFRNSVDGHEHHDDQGQSASIPHGHPEVVNNKRVPIPEHLKTEGGPDHVELDQEHAQGWDKPTGEGGKHHVDVKSYHPEDNADHPEHLAEDHRGEIQNHRKAVDHFKNNPEDYHSASSDVLHQHVGPHGVEELKEHHGEYPKSSEMLPAKVSETAKPGETAKTAEISKPAEIAKDGHIHRDLKDPAIPHDIRKVFRNMPSQDATDREKFDKLKDAAKVLSKYKHKDGKSFRSAFIAGQMFMSRDFGTAVSGAYSALSNSIPHIAHAIKEQREVGRVRREAADRHKEFEGDRNTTSEKMSDFDFHHTDVENTAGETGHWSPQRHREFHADHDRLKQAYEKDKESGASEDMLKHTYSHAYDTVLRRHRSLADAESGLHHPHNTPNAGDFEELDTRLNKLGDDTGLVPTQVAEMKKTARTFSQETLREFHDVLDHSERFSGQDRIAASEIAFQKARAMNRLEQESLKRYNSGAPKDEKVVKREKYMGPNVSHEDLTRRGEQKEATKVRAALDKELAEESRREGAVEGMEAPEGGFPEYYYKARTDMDTKKFDPKVRPDHNIGTGVRLGRGKKGDQAVITGHSQENGQHVYHIKRINPEYDPKEEEEYYSKLHSGEIKGEPTPPPGKFIRESIPVSEMHQNVASEVWSKATHDWHHSATEEQRNDAYDARHGELRGAYQEVENEKKRKEYQEMLDSIDLSKMSKKDRIEFGHDHGRWHEDIEDYHRSRDITPRQKKGQFDSGGNPENNKNTGFKFKGAYRNGTSGYIKDVEHDEKSGESHYVVDQVSKDGAIETKRYPVDALHRRGVSPDNAHWHPDAGEHRIGGEDEQKAEFDAQVQKLTGPKGKKVAEEPEEEDKGVVVTSDPSEFDVANPNQHFSDDYAAKSYELIDEDIGNYSQHLVKFFADHGGEGFKAPHAYDISDPDKMRQVWGHWLSQTDLSPEIHKEIFHKIQGEFTKFKSRMMGRSGKNDIGKLYESVEAGHYDNDPAGKSKAMARIRNHMMIGYVKFSSGLKKIREEVEGSVGADKAESMPFTPTSDEDLRSMHEENREMMGPEEDLTTSEKRALTRTENVLGESVAGADDADVIPMPTREEAPTERRVAAKRGSSEPVEEVRSEEAQTDVPKAPAEDEILAGEEEAAKEVEPTPVAEEEAPTVEPGEEEAVSPVAEEPKEEVKVEDVRDEYGEIDDDAAIALDKIAKDQDLGITKDREHNTVVRDADGNVIGGTYTSFDGDNYTFDVVVSKDAEGKGVGSKLLDDVAQIPDHHQEYNPDVTMKVHVVSPKMREMLERRGFKVVENVDNKDDVIMEPADYDNIGKPVAEKEAPETEVAAPKEAPEEAVTRREDSPGHYGKDAELHLTSGKSDIDKHSVKYKAVEADDLVQSHKVQAGGEFAPHEDYPEGVQPRTYADDAARAVLERADKFEPEQVMSENIGPNSGPPIVTRDGIVLGGNSRTMTQKHLYGTDRGDQVREHMIKNAEKFGLDAGELGKMKNPILVRELQDVHSQDSEVGDLNKLASGMNRSEAMSMTSEEDAVDLSRTLEKNKVFEKLAEKFNSDEHSTLHDFQDSNESSEFRETLKEALGNKAPAYFEPNGKLSKQGRDSISRAISARVINNPKLYKRLNEAPKKKLDAAALSTLLISKHESTHNLDNDLKQVFDAVDKVQRYYDGLPDNDKKAFSNLSEDEKLARVIGESQPELLGGEHELTTNPRARSLYHLIQNEKQTTVKNVFKELSNLVSRTGDSRQKDIFGGGEEAAAAPKTTSELISMAYEKATGNPVPEEYGELKDPTMKQRAKKLSEAVKKEKAAPEKPVKEKAPVEAAEAAPETSKKIDDLKQKVAEDQQAPTRNKKQLDVFTKIPKAKRKGMWSTGTITADGEIANILGVDADTKVKIRDISNENMDKLYDHLVKKPEPEPKKAVPAPEAKPAAKKETAPVKGKASPAVVKRRRKAVSDAAKKAPEDVKKEKAADAVERSKFLIGSYDDTEKKLHGKGSQPKQGDMKLIGAIEKEIQGHAQELFPDSRHDLAEDIVRHIAGGGEIDDNFKKKMSKRGKKNDKETLVEINNTIDKWWTKGTADTRKGVVNYLAKQAEKLFDQNRGALSDAVDDLHDEYSEKDPSEFTEEEKSKIEEQKVLDVKGKASRKKEIQDTFEEGIPYPPKPYPPKKGKPNRYSDEDIIKWAENINDHISEKQKYLLGYRGLGKPDTQGRREEIWDKKAKHDNLEVDSVVRSMKSNIKKFIEGLPKENKATKQLLFDKYPRLFKSVKENSVLFLNENLFKGDNLSEKRKRQAFKNSFGKHVSGVSTGDTPILNSEDEEETKKSLGLYVRV